MAGDFQPPYRNSQAPSDSVIRRENDFFIKEMKLVAFNGSEYDLMTHYVSFMYYEDIFMNCITGSLVMLDAIDYPQFMPLIGEERLRIKLTRQDESGGGREGSFLPDLTLNFRIYKVSGRSTQNEKVQTYELSLVSDEFIKNLKTKVYKTFKNKRYSEMVEAVYEKAKVTKPIVTEATKYDYNFCVRNLSPFEFINMIASRSISDDGNGEAYIFYEDRESFNFTSIGKLLSSGSQDKYFFAPRDSLTNGNSKFFASIDMPIQFEVKNVEHYYWNSQHDILRNIEAGMYAQHLTTVDLTRQMFTSQKFNLKEEFDSFKHVDNEKFFTDNLDALPTNEDDVFAHVKLMFTNKDHDTIEHIASREPGIKPYKLEEYVQRRTSNLHQINNFKVGVTVTGDPRRKVGQVVEFDLPQIAGDVSPERPQELDRYFQGKYLITSIRHTLTQAGGYTMEFEMIKDSFFKSIQHVNVLDKYKNII